MLELDSQGGVALYLEVPDPHRPVAATGDDHRPTEPHADRHREHGAVVADEWAEVQFAIINMS